MQILSVKESGKGFIINDHSLVPNDPDNSDFKRIQIWISEGGVVEPEHLETIV